MPTGWGETARWKVTTTTQRSDSTKPPRGSTGTLAVHIEDVEGYFIEGFEVGLRFETAAGKVIASSLWSDFVPSLNRSDIDAYYDSVLEQPMPAGPVIVAATANVGEDPGPVIPDVEGDLRCRLEVDVPANGQVEVEGGLFAATSAWSSASRLLRTRVSASLQPWRGSAQLSREMATVPTSRMDRSRGEKGWVTRTQT